MKGDAIFIFCSVGSFKGFVLMDLWMHVCSRIVYVFCGISTIFQTFKYL